MLPLPSGVGRQLRSHNGVNKVPDILLSTTRCHSALLCANGATPGSEYTKRAWRNAGNSETGMQKNKDQW